MKKLLIPFLLCCFSNAYAQTQDLIALAKGEFLGMNALYDENEDLFGYISIYNYGKTSEKTKKFEYVILDKNLNPFANNTFEGDITAGDYYGYISFDGSVILRPSRLDASHVKPKDMFTPSSMIIDLKTNTIKRKVYYDFDHGNFKEVVENNTWRENRKERKAERKENGFVYYSTVSEIKEGGYLAHAYDYKDAHPGEKSLMRYDEDKKLMWTYKYNPDPTKAKWQVLYYLEKDEKYFFALLRDYVEKGSNTSYGIQSGANSIPDKFYLLVLDMKTGKEVHKKEIPDPDGIMQDIMSFPTYSYSNLDNDKSFDDKIVMVGRAGVRTYKSGVSRLLIDRETFDVDLKALYYKDDFKEHIPHIKANGGVGKGYYLNPRDIFFMKDGSVGMLYEKYKPETEYTAVKTSDMIYIYFDKDFNIKGTRLFEKEKSKWRHSDYLFSQNLNDGNDLVFFYRDYEKDDEAKDKNWNLYINTLIGGKFNQEVIPISSTDDYMIYPYIAREGYIMLNEFNRKAKYNKIRLERLNY